jgi:hypothetical protein
MTRKQYRTAMGKVVDMGALMLQNENTRAVGNMNVNARGDKLNSSNQVIDRKTQQIKRQSKKQQTNVSNTPMVSSSNKKQEPMGEMPVDPTDTFEDLIEDEAIEEVAAPDKSDLQGGLAAAIAKAKTVQQTKLITPKQAAKQAGVRKI